MKAFFSKLWAWIVSHKIIAIAVASVVVVGSSCAVALPIALHKHSYSTEWSTDGENHWHSATCKHGEEKKDLASHVYDNACDTDCNVCGATRVTTHDHADTLTIGETTHWYACSICGDKKDEVVHIFDKEVASSEFIKAEATANTNAQYYKSCVCGKASSTEYFETDKAPANLQVSDISKTYDGTPVAEPTVTFDGVGAESFAYYKGDEKLTERPTNAGTYKVVVTVDETDTHAGDRVEREFTIAKKTLNYLEVTKVYNGKEGFNDSFDRGYVLGTEHGVVSGDVVILGTNDDIEYNVGTYVLSDSNGNWSLDDSCYLVGADADNYQFNYKDNGAVAMVTVTPKPLNLLDIEFTYDGGSIPVRFDLTAADGVIAGDDVYLYCDGNQDYYESYDEHTLYALDDSDDGYADAEYVEIKGDDAANYTFTYDTEGSVGKVTVMPYVLEFTGEYVKEYDGTHYVTFTQDITFSHSYVETVTVKLPLLDLDGQYITNAGIYTQENAQFGPPEFYVNGSENLGYDLDDSFYATESEFEVTVTQKALTGALILDVYYGDVKKLADSELYYYDQVISETEYGVLTGDSVTVRVLYPNPNAGTADTSFAIYGESNYVIGDLSVNNSTISQKIVTELPATLEVEYTGTNRFTMEIEIDGMLETLSFDAESHVVEISDYADCKITNVSLGDNYSLELGEDVTYEIKVGKKKLSNLDIRITYDVYDKHNVYLLVKDGIVEGQEVKLMIGYNHPTELPVGTVLTIQKSESFLHGEFYEIIASISGADKNNYELVATEDENGIFIYGTLTIVESCEIQENGDCACGGHITPLALGSAQVVSDQGVTEGEATYFSFKGNSGIYRISDYVVGTASSWATITVSLEDGTAVEPVREDEYFFKDDTVYRIKAVATNTLDYDTVMIKVVEAPVTMMENPNSSNVTTKLITVNLTAGSTGGWYKVYVESGSYYLSASAAFLKSGGLVYNSKGERVETFTGTNYWLEEGTYYFYIPLNGDMVTDTSVFYFNRNGMELDCQSDYDLSKSVKVNEKIYIKVNGAEGSMTEFTVAGDMDDEVRFTYEEYNTMEDLIAKTPSYIENEPTNSIWKDVDDTSNSIFVITITTGGSIVINVA